MDNQLFKKEWFDNKIKWYIKFLLFFIKTKYYTDKFECVQIEYKDLFGIRYILKQYQIPPNHPNCRCVIIPITKGKNK